MPRLGILLVCAATCLGCRSEARTRDDEAVVTLVATAEVKGMTEPCGCTSDPLGDLARVAALAKGGLLLDAGGLLYDREAMAPAMREQADAKAATLAAVYGRGAVGLGADDLVRGRERVAPPRQAANVDGIARAEPRVFTVAGVKVGVFGVATPDRVKPLGAGDPRAAAQAAVAALQKNGAQVIVALLGMDRAEARALVENVPGIGFGIVGADVGEGMVEAEPVGRGFLVAPADQARRVARIELHVRGGQVALVPFGGAAAQRVALERITRRIASLTIELAGWKGDPQADPAFVKARSDELEQLEKERTRIRDQRPEPPAGSYFTYALEPIRTNLPRDPQVADALRQMQRRIGVANLAAARALPPPPAVDNQPTYVGSAACAKCHKPAVEFWQHTVHAAAWKTLVDVDKQYDYDCTGCHVTGWQKPGGSHLASVEKKGLVDVQCEVCHGPASRHVAEAGLDEPKTLTLRPADRFCADNCHTKEHSDTFQLVPYLRDVVGAGHGAARRKELGAGVTGHELRQKALAAARHG